MVAVRPVVMPVTVPLSEPTVATSGLELVHRPPGTTSLKLVVPPAHTVAAPLMGSGEELTVTVMEAAQPVGRV